MDLLLTSGIIVVVGGTGWLICALLQRKAHLYPNTIKVPQGLAWLSGAKHNTVIPRLLSIQILIIAFVFWSILVITIFPMSEFRRLLWQRGCLFFFLVV